MRARARAATSRPRPIATAPESFACSGGRARGNASCSRASGMRSVSPSIHLARGVVLLAAGACGGGPSDVSSPTGPGDASETSDANDASRDDGGTPGDADAMPAPRSDATPAPPTFTTTRGPINDGPDPFMTYYDGNYYLSTTQGDAL